MADRQTEPGALRRQIDAAVETVVSWPEERQRSVDVRAGSSVTAMPGYEEAVTAARRILGGYSANQDERWRGLPTWERHDERARAMLAAAVPILVTATREVHAGAARLIPTDEDGQRASS